jgi:uncharacterized protein
MVRQIKRVTLHIIGWLLIVVGVAGLVLPIMPGIIPIIIGIYLLSLTSLWFRSKKDVLAARYPHVGRFVTWLDAKLGHLNML